MSAKTKTTKNTNDFGEFSDNPDKLYEIVEQLSEENTQLKDDNLELRFLLCVVIFFTFMIIGLSKLSWLPATIILLLGIFLLIEIGKRCGVEEVIIYRDRLFYWIEQYLKNKNN